MLDGRGGEGMAVGIVLLFEYRRLGRIYMYKHYSAQWKLLLSMIFSRVTMIEAMKPSILLFTYPNKILACPLTVL